MRNISKSTLQVAVSTLLTLGGGAAQAVPLPGGTLDPLTIPKYVTPLVIPPVMNKTGVDATGGDLYDIAVRQFKQQILPGGIWNTVTGRTDAFPPTTIWSYGPAADPVPDSSTLGGAAGVAPAPNSQFNYPSYTVENIKDVKTTVNWINGLVDANGDALPHLFAVDQSLHWANPAANCKSGEVRTDCAGTSTTPYSGPVPMVSHLHGAHVGSSSDGYTEAWWLPDANNINCIPRDANGTLTGVPTGLDPATNTWNVACEGNIANQMTDHTGAIDANTNNPANGGQGMARYAYTNDQPSTTLWFHDHSLGMTRLNVYAGPAGFWLIRDAAGVGGETGLAAGSILPSPAPVAGETLATTNFPASMGGSREKYREIPMVIQGRSFNADGSLFYPDNRAFFEGLNVAGTDAGGNGQFPAGTGELQIGMDPATSDIAPMWNPEAFFNTMVVNGTTWPQLDVAPAQYRFRLLNGSNSRFLNLALKITDVAGNPVSVRKSFYRTRFNGNIVKRQTRVNELTMFQIGSDQSLSPTVTAVETGYATELKGWHTVLPNGKVTFPRRAPSTQQALLMGLAERADVIVDFRGLPNGTIITMTNTAPDAPFGGFPDIPADASTTGQVMRFVVNDTLLGLSPTDELRDPVTHAILNPLSAATEVDKLVVDPAALGNFSVGVTNPVARELALIEEESALICVDADLLGNVVQLPGHTPVAGACQDAGGNVHPTALPFAPKAAVLGSVDAAGVPAVTLWSDPIITNVNADGTGTQTAEQWNLWNFTVDGHPIHIHLVKFKVLSRSAIGGGPSIISNRRNRNQGVQAWENGWKDTVITYPGEVTSIAANFDINGLYVWHCHILEHEDNEMMVPMCVGTAGVDCPAQLF